MQNQNRLHFMTNDIKNCSYYSPLIMGFVDDELSPEEKHAVNQHLIRCQSCREEYETFASQDTRLETVSFVEPTDMILDQLWKTPFNRLARHGGLFLMLGGYLGFMLFAVIEVWKDKETIPAIFITGILIGVLMLFLQALIERLKTYKKDPYKDIKR